MNIEKHKRRFIKLATVIFALVGVGHALRALYSWPMNIAGWNVPLYISWLAVVLTFSMVLMGATYLRK